jgi:predicted amino acid dehydrogenase
VKQGFPGPLARFVLDDVECVTVSIPWLPEDLLADQEGALEAMRRGVYTAGPVDAIGLGSLLAVIAGRGVALQEHFEVPVTNGAAATTWAALENTLRVHRERGGRVAVLGFAGAVGQALAAALVDRGLEVVAGGRGKPLERRARQLGLELLPDAEAVAGCSIVVGAATTGGTLEPSALSPGTVLLDVALPPTLRPGPRPPGVRVLAAEAVEIPKGWRRGFWGHVYHVISGYGPRQVYACLLEPVVLARLGRSQPFAQGRRLEPQQLADFSQAAASMGLRPRLSR